MAGPILVKHVQEPSLENLKSKLVHLIQYHGDTDRHRQTSSRLRYTVIAVKLIKPLRRDLKSTSRKPDFYLYILPITSPLFETSNGYSNISTISSINWQIIKSRVRSNETLTKITMLNKVQTKCTTTYWRTCDEQATELN